jgi:hypothetical protein
MYIISPITLVSLLSESGSEFNLNANDFPHSCAQLHIQLKQWCTRSWTAVLISPYYPKRHSSHTSKIYIPILGYLHHQGEAPSKPGSLQARTLHQYSSHNDNHPPPSLELLFPPEHTPQCHCKTGILPSSSGLLLWDKNHTLYNSFLYLCNDRICITNP